MPHTGIPPRSEEESFKEWLPAGKNSIPPQEPGWKIKTKWSKFKRLQPVPMRRVIRHLLKTGAPLRAGYLPSMESTPSP